MIVIGNKIKLNKLTTAFNSLYKSKFTFNIFARFRDMDFSNYSIQNLQKIQTKTRR